MMGFGYYDNGGSSSSSSNLSALAPPFMVEQSNPVMDFTVPPYHVPVNSCQNWVPSHCSNASPHFSSNPIPEVESMPYSNAYRSSPSTQLPPLNPVADAVTGGFVFGQCSDGIHHSSLMVPEQPTYVLSSTPHVGTLNRSLYNDYTQIFSGLENPYCPDGLWNGFADWQRGKVVDIDVNIFSKENEAGSFYLKNYMDQGIHANNDLSTGKETSAVLHSPDMLGREKFDILRSTSALPETHPQVSSLKFDQNSRSHEMPYWTSRVKKLSHHDTSLDDFTSAMKCSPVLSITPPTVDYSFSAPNADSFKDVNPGSDAANVDFTGNDPSTTKNPHLSVRSGRRDRFDASQLRIHLERNDHSLLESSLTESKELSNNKSLSKDDLDNLFLKSRSGSQVPYTSSDGLSLALDNGEVSYPVENSSKGLDPCNHAVDSPCWKGVPISHFSPFETSDAVASHLMKKQEASNVLNLQGPQFTSLRNDAAVEVSSLEQSKRMMYYKYGCLGNDFAPSPERSSVINCYSREHWLDDTAKEETYHPKANCDSQILFSNDIHDPRKGYTLPNRLKGRSVFEPSHNSQQSLEGCSVTSEEKHESGTGVTEIGMSVNDTPKDNSSCVPFHFVGHVLHSPSSVEVAATKFSKSYGGEPTPEIDVQMLVNTMHNLSELLLFHCSNDACDLKEPYCEDLKNVINNLDTCLSKTIEKKTATQESLPSRQDASDFLGEFPKLKKGVHLDGRGGTNLASVSVQEKLGYEHVHEAKKQYVVSGEKGEKISELVSQRSGAYLEQDDKMTQAIKKVLSENFDGGEETQLPTLLYKNLWLEAEAALCSINYRARYNRMKIGMDKAKDVPESTTKVENFEELLRSKVSSDKVISDSNPDTSIQDFPNMSRSFRTDDFLDRFDILKTRVDNSKSERFDPEEPSSSKVSHDPSKINKLVPETKDGLSPDVFIQDFLISSENRHADDVMDRFHMLKSRVDNSNSVNTIDEEELSSSKVFHVLSKVDKLVPKDGLCPDDYVLDSPVSSKNSHADDVDDAVMARLRILRYRMDNSSSMDVEGQPMPDEQLKPLGSDSLRQPANCCTEDNWIMKEFHRCDPLIQSHRTNVFENQLHAGWSDSSSSDWEHVLKDEFIG